MLLIWIFAGVFVGILSQICPNFTRFNKCGETVKTNIASSMNTVVLPLESLNYICWRNKSIVQCFLDGLEACPYSNITYKRGAKRDEWDISLFRELIRSSCQTPGADAFKANYDCMTNATVTGNYSKCMSNAIEANPIGVYRTISCRLQKESKNCITKYIGNKCKNQTALDFYFRWYYVKGKFEPECKKVNGAESLMTAATFPLFGTIYIFLIVLL